MNVFDLRSVTYRFNRVVALDRLTMAVPAGTRVALLGANGSGKSTLLRVLAGLYFPESGRVEFRGEPLTESRFADDEFAHGFRRRVGLVFQNPDVQLFNATVRDEILFRIPQPDLKLYRSLLQALDLVRYEQTPPLLLSEGEKRRLALASVLMRQPLHGVLLDEPALGQDAAHKAMLLRILRAIATRGKLALFSTHDIELASQADLMLLMNPEGIVASGAPQQVLRDQGAWQKLGLIIPEWVRR